MKSVAEFDREDITTLFVSWAVMGLLAQGYSIDSARCYLLDRRWIESDGPIERLVRGVFAAITELLGSEADAEAFLSRRELWSIFRDPALEVVYRMVASPASACRLVEEWQRDQAEADADAISFLADSLEKQPRRPRAKAAKQRRGGRGAAGERAAKEGSP